MIKKINFLPLIGAAFISVLLLLFRLPISYFIDFLLVRPVFSFFESGLSIDLTVLIVLSSLVYWVSFEFNKAFLFRAALYCSVFYCFQRINPFWSFKSMFILPQVMYWDLVCVAILMPYVLKHLFIKDVSNDSSGDHASMGFIEDNVVTKTDQDQFKRRVAAEQIACLMMTTNNKKSFAIGVLGEYGSGKTSFLNLINHYLYSESVVKISFDPWSASSAEMIRREFFDMLAGSIATVNPKISSLIYSYGRKLSNVDEQSHLWLKRVGFLRGVDSTQHSGEYQQIKKMLTSANKKIVITIDDLDRLYPAEVMEVLKLIRNTADFPNVFYLVGYDKAYVQRAIKNLNEGSDYDYMDKIFQMEIPLPKREADDLLVYLTSQIKGTISEKHFAVFEDKIINSGFHNRYEKAYSGVLRQGRDVVRFLNCFKLSYVLIGDEVDFESLFILELIKFRFPRIYDLLYEQSDEFLYRCPVRTTHEEYLMPRMAKDSEDKLTRFRIYVEKLDYVKKEDVQLLENLFKMLFNGGDYHRPEAKNSISYPLYFEIYFRFRLSTTDISDKDFRLALDSGKMYDFMTYCASHNLHKELLTRLMQEDISKSRMHFENIIMFVFSFGRTYVEKEGEHSFPYDSLIDKIYNYHNVIVDKFYKHDAEEFKRFVTSLFDMARPKYLFENELIYHLKKKGDSFVIPIDQLIDYQLSFFRNYAESGHGLSENTMSLFWAARHDYTTPGPDPGTVYKHWEFEPALISYMVCYLKDKDPKEFLKFSIERDMRDRSLMSISSHVLEMFESPLEYRKLIAENPALDDEIKKEYIELIDKYAETDFKKFVQMEFDTELKRAEVQEE